MIPLTKQQKEIMKEFYCIPATKVVFNKAKRNELWRKATSRIDDFDFVSLKEKCPALEHQIQRSYLLGTIYNPQFLANAFMLKLSLI